MLSLLGTSAFWFASLFSLLDHIDKSEPFWITLWAIGLLVFTLFWVAEFATVMEWI